MCGDRPAMTAATEAAAEDPAAAPLLVLLGVPKVDQPTPLYEAPLARAGDRDRGGVTVAAELAFTAASAIAMRWLISRTAAWAASRGDVGVPMEASVSDVLLPAAVPLASLAGHDTGAADSAADARSDVRDERSDATCSVRADVDRCAAPP
jgi:hypothetical protein